jgi:hypothetical protein
VVNVVGWPSEWADANQLAIAVPGAVTPGVGSLILTGYAPTCVPTTNPPDLISVGASAVGGDTCSSGEWIITPSWTVTGPDDVGFRTDLEVANDAAGVSYSGLVGGLTTASSSYDDLTGVQGNTGGVSDPVTYYRRYKVKLIRNSDDAIIESMETGQLTLTVYSEFCE